MILVLILTMLCGSYESRGQGYLLNDTTYCTSVEEIESWANSKLVLQAEKEYLKQQLAVERTDNKQTKKDLNAIRKQLFFIKSKNYLTGLAAALVGFGIGKI